MSEGMFRTDKDVLSIAQRIFPQAGYATESLDVQGNSILLAENAYSIVAFAAPATIDDLVLAETLVEEILCSRIESVDVGPKYWDSYIVLLTREPPTERGDGLLPLFNINYDTRGVRRIARVGVEASEREVRRALTPFVEPARRVDGELGLDPLEAMPGALARHGIDPSIASRSVEIFRQGGRLVDAL